MFKNKSVIVGEIYRVPNTSERDYLELYSEHLNNITNVQKFENVILGTDQNIDYLKINHRRNIFYL